MRTLPIDIRLPKLRRPTDLRDWSDNSFIELIPDNQGNLTVNTGSSTFKLRTFEDFLLLFKTKNTWTLAPHNVLDCIFKNFDESLTGELYYKTETKHGEYSIRWCPGTHKVTLRLGNDYRVLSDMSCFVSKDFEDTSLEAVKDVFEKLKVANSTVGINLISSGSTTQDWVVSGEGYKQFQFLDKLGKDKLQYLYEGYIGPRQEAISIGGPQEEEVSTDIKKAYLRQLGLTPSLEYTNILAIGVDAQPDMGWAHPGSVYTIDTTIPEGIRFPPIPVHNAQGRLAYPFGDLKGVTVSKFYLKALQDLGITYKITKSLQIILKDPTLTPLKEKTYLIELFETSYKEALYPLDLKLFHYTLVGHMLHFHKVYPDDGGSFYQETSKDFNPVLANAIQGAVAYNAWWEAMHQNARAITVDGNIGKDLTPSEGWSIKGTGTHFLYTPNYKDRPGSTKYADMVKDTPNEPFINITPAFKARRSFKEAWQNPEKIGNIIKGGHLLKPSGGSRHLSTPIKEVKILLNEEVEAKVPKVGDYPINEGVLPRWLVEGR